MFMLQCAAGACLQFAIELVLFVNSWRGQAGERGVWVVELLAVGL